MVRDDDVLIAAQMPKTLPANTPDAMPHSRDRIFSASLIGMEADVCRATGVRMPLSP